MTFYKYQGTGNDFILFDNRESRYTFAKEQIAALCNRRFGIGADGLMLLDDADGYHFRMTYYNSNGGESTMCGNGGRCMVAFAKSLGIIVDRADFLAIDGEHTATIGDDGIVSLHMVDVQKMAIFDGYTILDTGSPHYVLWVKDVNEADVVHQGRLIRNYMQFQPDGINVNFAAMNAGHLSVRTYERGVEDETLSCGTGVTAAAIAATCSQTGTFKTTVTTLGGDLEVSFEKDTPHSARNVVLTGPAVFVYKGFLHAV